jgi:hypothetical protein
MSVQAGFDSNLAVDFFFDMHIALQQDRVRKNIDMRYFLVALAARGCMYGWNGPESI